MCIIPEFKAVLGPFLLFLFNFFPLWAVRIDLDSVFQKWGHVPTYHRDGILRELWKDEKAVKLLRMYADEQDSILQQSILVNHFSFEQLLGKLKDQRKQVLEEIWGLYQRKSPPGNGVDIEVFWKRFYSRLESGSAMVAGGMVFNQSIPQERWKVMDPYSQDHHPDLERLYLSLIGVFSDPLDFTENGLEIYLRAHRAILPSLRDGDSQGDLTREILQGGSGVADPEREAASQTKKELSYGVVQKDLIFLLHPKMRNYHWVSGRFRATTHRVPISNKSLEKIRIFFLKQKVTRVRERLLEKLMLLRPGPNLEPDRSLEQISQVENEILDVLDLIRARENLSRLFYENVLLKRDFSDLSRSMRILHPILPDYSLIVLREIYLRHGFSSEDWSILEKVLKNILLDREEVLGKV